MLPDFTDRISLLELVSQRFPDGIGVEVGAASGCFTRQILASWTSLKTLHCVDLWAHQPEGYHDDCNLSDEVQEERHDQFRKDFGDNKKVRILKQWSHIAATLFSPESIHFCYLDANHSKAGCLSDLMAWWPVLKPGGIMAGHDYFNGDGDGMGVKAAVDLFAAERGLIVKATKQEFTRPEGVYGGSWEGFSFVMEK